MGGLVRCVSYLRSLLKKYAKSAEKTESLWIGYALATKVMSIFEQILVVSPLRF